jgi:hypothetical protein
MLGAAGEGANPEMNMRRQKRLESERQQRTTYEVLLAAGAPDETACAAALNPQVLQAVFGRRQNC